MSADEEDADAEEDERDRQRSQDPDLQAEDAVPVVRGQVADYTHKDHCRGTTNTHTHTHTHTHTQNTDVTGARVFASQLKGTGFDP